MFVYIHLCLYHHLVLQLLFTYSHGILWKHTYPLFYSFQLIPPLLLIHTKGRFAFSCHWKISISLLVYVISHETETAVPSQVKDRADGDSINVKNGQQDIHLE